MKNQCEHGQLARVCEVCALQARLAECERISMAMSKDVATAITTAAFATGHGDSVLDMVNELVGQASDFRAEVARLNALLEADGDALKGRAVTIAGLRAQLAETQKHAEKSREMSLIDLARKQEAEDKYTQLLIEHAETQKLLEVQLAVGDKLTAEVARLQGEVVKRNQRALDGDKLVNRWNAEYDRAERLEAKLAALREAIFQAPHGVQCAVVGGYDYPCNCWKRDALRKPA